jgi:hypothetical protein
MRLTVTIDDRAWAKFAARVARELDERPTDIIEGAVAYALTEDGKLGAGTNYSSTSVMLILGRVKVEVVPEERKADDSSTVPH